MSGRRARARRRDRRRAFNRLFLHRVFSQPGEWHNSADFVAEHPRLADIDVRPSIAMHSVRTGWFMIDEGRIGA
jgi:hypothetical protein